MVSNIHTVVVVKTVILASGQEGQVWKVEPGTPYLEATLVGKYLEVDYRLKAETLSMQERSV